MSIVREIVQSNALITMDKLVKELPKLKEDVVLLKNSTLSYIDEVYVKFTSCTKTNHLLNQVEKLQNKAEELNENIGSVVKVEVESTKDDIKLYKDQLELVNTNLQLCYKLNNLHEQLHTVQMLMSQGRFVQATEILVGVEASCCDPCSKMMQHMHTCALQLRNTLSLEVENVFEENVTYNVQEEDGILIHKFTFAQKSVALEEAVYVLGILNERHLLNMCTQIWKVLDNIMQYAVLIDLTKTNAIIKVKKNMKDSYSTVFKNVDEFSNFLSANLQYMLKDNVTLMGMVQEQLGNRLSEALVLNCLKDTIPNTEEELLKYAQVQQAAELLEAHLKEYAIIPISNTSLGDFTGQINGHFVTKKCQSFVNTATILMKQDLHDTKLVGTAYNPMDGFIQDGFPQCAVSNSVVKLLKLAGIMLQDAQTADYPSSQQYIQIVDDTLSNYKTFVARHHERFLKTIRQQVAILYNNCKYIAHEVNTLKWQEFSPQLTNAISLSADASDMWDEMVAAQVDDMKKRIDQSGIHLANDQLDAMAEKTIRQCLREQELLKTVWQKVLNYFDYNHTMGILLDALCTNAIANILKIADIPSDVADQLVDILKLIQTRGPKLFTEPNEILMYVPSWDKLSETVFVLNSSLAHIGERWADHKGPLALHFKPDEMRTMIRALFQNSDQRASLLDKIG